MMRLSYLGNYTNKCRVICDRHHIIDLPNIFPLQSWALYAYHLSIYSESRARVMRRHLPSFHQYIKYLIYPAISVHNLKPSYKSGLRMNRSELGPLHHSKSFPTQLYPWCCITIIRILPQISTGADNPL